MESLPAKQMKYVFRKKQWRFLAPLADAFFSLLPKHKLFPPQQILIFRADGIGDTLLTLPFIEAVLQAFPKSKVSVCVPPECASLFDGNSRVYRLLTFKVPWNREHEESVKKFAVYLSRFGFDTAFEPRGDLRNVLLLRKANIRQIIGFGITGGGPLLSYCAPYERGIPVGENHRRLLTPFGKIAEKVFTLHTTEADKVFLKSLPLRFKDQERPFFVAHPFAATIAKQWPLFYWKELLRRIDKELGGTFFLLGRRRDEGAMRFIAPHSAVLLPGVFTLRKIYFLMKECAGFIGVDSSMAHLAALVDIPRVILFSGTNDEREYAPTVTPKQKVLSTEVACAPCEQVICSVTGHPCMSDLTVECVEQEVLSWFP